jgi:hypothetical protein
MEDAMQKTFRTVAVRTALAATLSLAAGTALAQSTSDAEPGKPFSLLQFLTRHAAASKPSDTAAAKPEPKAATSERARPRTAERARSRKVHFASRHRDVARRHEHETAAAETIPPPDAWPTLAAPAPAAAVATDGATAAAPGPNPAAAPAQTQVSELVVGGHTVQIASPDQVNALDLAADQQAANQPASDQPATTAAPSDPAATADARETAQGDAADDADAAPPSHPANPADASAAPDQVVAFARQADDDTTRHPSWLAELLATLGGAIAAGSVAWFLIGSAPQRRLG